MNKDTSSLNSFARSLLYFVTVSGLYILAAIAFFLLWKYVLAVYLDLPALSFLECGGVISFVYILVFSVKYGLSKNTDNVSSVILAEKEKISAEQCKNAKENIKNMSEEEIEALSDVLARCCGIERKTRSE